MIEPSEILKDVEAHNEICRKLLEFVQQENQWLSAPSENQSPPPDQSVKASLSKSLSEAVALIQGHRAALQDAQQQNPDAAKHPEVQAAIQSATDLIMKIVVLDRDNEKLLMKKGMVPANQIPSVQQFRPGDALKAYQRNPS